MLQNQIIQEIESEYLKKDIPAFRIGDTLNVYLKIVEGENTRIQIFKGILISRRGRGLSESISLYKVAQKSGMERVFLIHSPNIEKIEIEKRGQVRKSKLYYLRGVSGKASRVKERTKSRSSKVQVVSEEDNSQSEE